MDTQEQIQRQQLQSQIDDFIITNIDLIKKAKQENPAVEDSVFNALIFLSKKFGLGQGAPAATQTPPAQAPTTPKKRGRKPKSATTPQPTTPTQTTPSTPTTHPFMVGQFVLSTGNELFIVKYINEQNDYFIIENDIREVKLIDIQSVTKFLEIMPFMEGDLVSAIDAIKKKDVVYQINIKDYGKKIFNLKFDGTLDLVTIVQRLRSGIFKLLPRQRVIPPNLPFIEGDRFAWPDGTWFEIWKIGVPTANDVVVFDNNGEQIINTIDATIDVIKKTNMTKVSGAVPSDPRVDTISIGTLFKYKKDFIGEIIQVDVNNNLIRFERKFGQDRMNLYTFFNYVDSGDIVIFDYMDFDLLRFDGELDVFQISDISIEDDQVTIRDWPIKYTLEDFQRKIDNREVEIISRDRRYELNFYGEILKEGDTVWVKDYGMWLTVWKIDAPQKDTVVFRDGRTQYFFTLTEIEDYLEKKEWTINPQLVTPQPANVPAKTSNTTTTTTKKPSKAAKLIQKSAKTSKTTTTTTQKPTKVAKPVKKQGTQQIAATKANCKDIKDAIFGLSLLNDPDAKKEIQRLKKLQKSLNCK